MVETVDCDEYSGSSELNFEVQSIEKDHGSSSCSHLKLNLIGMGFSPVLVDKAIQEHGENNVDLLLETLFTLSAPESENSESESGHSQDDATLYGINGATNDESLCGVRKFEELSSDDALLNKRSMLLMMNFASEDIDFALDRLGKHVALAEVVDFVIAYQNSEVKDDQVSCEGVKGTTAIKASVDPLTHQLLEMGFSEEEISMAIDSFGPETPVSELADSIFAKRIAYDDKDMLSCTIQQNSGKKSEPVCTAKKPQNGSFLAGDTKRSSLYAGLCQPEFLRKAKMGKSKSAKSWESASHSKESKESEYFKSSKVPVDLGNRYDAPALPAKSALSNGQTLPLKISMDTNKCRKYPSERPYLLYGNVIHVPDEAWEKLSRFLYGIEIEYMNAELFSALTRKEGFIHNLPLENRFRICPGSPMTIQDALPLTRKSWPSWDTRTKINCVCTDPVDIRRIGEELGKIMVHSQGILSSEKRTSILHRCRALSLTWAGEHSLVPLAPHDAEVILGYPAEHTRLSGLEDAARLMLLKRSFQTDLLGYLFSPLKPLYPDGLTVLSVFSGIGGAEIALSKLGIHLKCVVSIETSEDNRKILRRWWDSTKQSGVLWQVSSIQELSGQKIQHMVEEVGGFDLVVAGNLYAEDVVRSDIEAGVNFTLYFEFVRLYQMVRGIMTRRK